MNYIDEIATRIGAKCSLSMDDARDAALLRSYALLLLVTGRRTTEENVHDAWSAWRAQTQPHHKSLVPFGELTADVQSLDEPYVKAIHDVVDDLAAEKREAETAAWEKRYPHGVLVMNSEFSGASEKAYRCRLTAATIFASLRPGHEIAFRLKDGRVKGGRLHVADYAWRPWVSKAELDRLAAEVLK